MTDGDWPEIERLFLEASGLAPAERAAFFDQACVGLPALRAEVESLLDADPARGEFLDRRPSRLAADFLDRPPAPLAAIGPYRILSLLGEGGMGTVYLAEQQTPHRVVAVKVIRAGMASEQVLRRFGRESDALGRLQHPGIAQIYDAGAADSGFGPQPYFAMEFIQGRPLMDYGAQQSLENLVRPAGPCTTEGGQASGGLPGRRGPARARDVRVRLELMAKVCDAVEHAHQRGILHRDLKPGNILVDGAGQPKILDFGVAMVMDSDVQATRQTDLGQLIGTLAYMSPEQALGNPLVLDVRSDVYALGIILYELLAGRLPYQTNRGGLHEAVQAIREEDPAPLSAIHRGFRGDIQTIVAKALEKEKERRYASAGELAGDIRRYLADQPIAARPPSAIYQLRKFSHRYKAVVMGTSAVLVALVAGTVVSAWQAVRARTAEHTALAQRDRASGAERMAKADQELARNQRDRAVSAEASAQLDRNSALAAKLRADSEAASAKAVNDFLENDLLAQADVSRQSGAGLDPDLKVRTALDRAADRISGKFDRQPEVEASVRDTIGQTYRSLGLYPEARKQLERALELRRRALGPEDPRTLATLSRLGQVTQDQGRYPQAEALYRQALQAQRRLLGPEHPDTLIGMSNLAAIALAQGKYAQAETLSSQTLEIQRRVLGPANPSTLNTMNGLANAYFQQGKYAQAEALGSQTLEIKRRVLGPEHPSTLIGMNNVASAYARQGKYAQAEMLYAEAVEIKSRVLGPEHPRTLDSMDNLAGTYSRQGKYEQAGILFSQTLEIRRRVLGIEHPSTLNNMGALAGIWARQGKYAEAETLFGQTLEIQRRVSGPEHPSTLGNMAGLGVTYSLQGKYAQAEAILSQTLEIQRRVLGPEHQNALETASDLLTAYQEQGKFALAEPLARQIVDIDRKKQPDRWQRFLAESMLGSSLAGQKRFAEAEPLLLGGFRGMEARKGQVAVSDLLYLDQARARIVQLYRAWGKPQEAAQWGRN